MRKQTPKTTLRRKFIWGCLLLAVVLSAVLCVLGYLDLTELYTKFYSEKAFSAASIAADLVGAKNAERYLTTLTADEKYREVSDRLSSVKEETRMKYLYVFYPAEDGYLYLFDAKASWDDEGSISRLGAKDAYVAGNANMLNVMRTGKPVKELIVTNSALGYVGTVFVPVLDENGKSVALVGADVSMHEMLKSRQRFVLRTILTSVLTVGALVAIYLLYLQRRLVSPLRNLTASVASYVRAQDKPRYVPADIHTHDEVETLSDAFSQMAEDMREYIDHLRAATAEKQRIQTELDVARDIQLSMLPNVFPPFPECDEFSIYATIDPAKEVGGDFYDFYRLDENRLCFLIADVSGKGVPAALFMMIARALLKNEMQEGGTPAEVMETVNGQLCEGNEQSMFVTALVMVLDTKAHTLRYVNAGHNPPLLRRAGGSFEYMSLRRSPPLAVVPGKKYEGVTIPFASGDTLFLYTDGVTEALNPREELYGEDRLRAALNESAGDAEPAGLIGDVTRALAQYVQGATQADDITMLAVKATR